MEWPDGFDYRNGFINRRQLCWIKRTKTSQIHLIIVIEGCKAAEKKINAYKVICLKLSKRFRMTIGGLAVQVQDGIWSKTGQRALLLIRLERNWLIWHHQKDQTQFKQAAVVSFSTMGEQSFLCSTSQGSHSHSLSQHAFPVQRRPVNPIELSAEWKYN